MLSGKFGLTFCTERNEEGEKKIRTHYIKHHVPHCTEHAEELWGARFVMQDQRGLVLAEKGDWNFSTSAEGQQSGKEPGLPLPSHPSSSVSIDLMDTCGMGNSGHPNNEKRGPTLTLITIQQFWSKPRKRMVPNPPVRNTPGSAL